MAAAFRDAFVDIFRDHYDRIFRFLDRLGGDPDLAADLAQEAFVRLYRRGVMPDAPEAWLISVAANLFRNVRSQRSRRSWLLTPARAEELRSDCPDSPEEVMQNGELRDRVRAALDRLSERDRQLLLLRAEGYSYREIGGALALHEASVGTLLARAKRAFRVAYEESVHASKR